jgi:hypothetical protein
MNKAPCLAGMSGMFSYWRFSVYQSESAKMSIMVLKKLNWSKELS